MNDKYKVSKLLLDGISANQLDEIMPHYSYRWVGTSTGIALEAIGIAMKRPEEKVYIRDHFGASLTGRHTFNMVCGLLEKLGLKYFKVNRADLSIGYRPFVTVERKSTWSIIDEEA